MRGRPVGFALASGVGVVVLVAGAVVVYVQLLRAEPPPPLAVGDRASDVLDAPSATSSPASPSPSGSTAPSGPTTTATTPSTGPGVDGPGVDGPGAGITGTWTVTGDSVVGYRAEEDFVGGLQHADGVGRTDAVTGSVVVDGTTVVAASFVVDVSTLRSDEPRRDRQVRDRLLDTATWPTAAFTLTAPVELGRGLGDGDRLTATATGELTLRDRTLPVTCEVTVLRDGDEIQVLGAIEVVFVDWGIPDPSNAIVSVGDRATLEFSLWVERTGP
jgi:polyisoprenoid-binding protein YceI